MKSSKGGYRVLGGWTEGTFPIADDENRNALKQEIMDLAEDPSFLVEAGFEAAKSDKATPRSAKRWFFRLLRHAEVVGSTKGGAAGYLKMRGEQRYKLRIAIAPMLPTTRTPGSASEGNSRLRTTIIKHELGHFVREAKVRAHGRSWLWFLESRSLFRQERRAGICYFYNIFIVLTREEWLVWWFSLPNWRWRLGMVVPAAVGLALVLAKALELSGAVALVVVPSWSNSWLTRSHVEWSGAVMLAVALAIMIWCITSLTWRR